MRKTAEQIAAIVLKKLGSVSMTDPKDRNTFARTAPYKTEGSSTYTQRLTPDVTPPMPDGTEDEQVGAW